jgi:hypothetical protein
VAQRAVALIVSNAVELGLNCRQTSIDKLSPPFTILLVTFSLQDPRVKIGIQAVVRAGDGVSARELHR